jgi:hypothetical protein
MRKYKIYINTGNGYVRIVGSLDETTDFKVMYMIKTQPKDHQENNGSPYPIVQIIPIEEVSKLFKFRTMRSSID